MVTRPDELIRLFNGEILSKEERRSLATTLIAKLLMMAAVIALISTSFVMRSGFVREHVVIACAISIVAAHLVITFGRAHNTLRGFVLVFGIFFAGAIAVPDLESLLFGSSSMFLAVPAVIAAVTLRPVCTILYWIVIQVVAVILAITLPHEFNTFATMSLLVVCVTVWVATARADRVIDILVEEKRLVEEARDEAKTAIGVIVEYERHSLEQARRTWPVSTRQTAVSKN